MNSAQFIDQPSCYLCGGKHRSLERELGTEEGQLYLRWVRCSDCSLVYLDPRPTVHALSALYDSQGYWRGDSGYQDYLADERWRGKQARDRAEWLAHTLRDRCRTEAPSVLEVGSAAGFFLQELTKLGVAAQGLDLSRPMVRLSEKRGNVKLKVKQSSVEDARYPLEYFDGIAAWGCDSNFDNPSGAFQKFHSWLKLGGLLTFNFHDYDHWATALKGNFKLMPNALYFLNEKNVRALLNKTGFELVELKTEFSWMNVASVYHHTGHLWLTPFKDSALARLPIKLPVPGSFRVLARKMVSPTANAT